MTVDRQDRALHSGRKLQNKGIIKICLQKRIFLDIEIKHTITTLKLKNQKFIMVVKISFSKFIQIKLIDDFELKLTPPQYLHHLFFASRSRVLTYFTQNLRFYREFYLNLTKFSFHTEGRNI